MIPGTRSLLFAAFATIPALGSAQTFSGTAYPLGTTLGSGPRGLAVGDVNHDGAVDVVANNSASTTAGNVSVFLGNANGTLAPPTILLYGTGTPATADGNAALEDYDMDGDLDFLFSNGSSSFSYGFSVFTNDGTGTFTIPAAPAGTTNSSVTQLVCADFSGDLVPDVIQGSYSSDQFFYFAGNFGGAFSPAIPIPFPSPDGTVTGNLGVADIDNDGDLDWASGRYYSAGGCGFAVFFNNSGTFSKNTYSINSTSASATESVSFGDFDEDGDQDVVIVNDVTNQVHFFTNSGAGGGFLFAPSAQQAPMAIGATSYNTSVGDVTHDGHLDVVVAQQGPDNVNILKGLGHGKFAAGPLLATAPLLNPYQTAIADLNLDGQPDLVVGDAGASLASSGVTVFLQTTAPFANTAQYGNGTSGCSGTLTMAANGVPTIGDGNFRITCVNVPRNALGLFLIGDVTAASDYLFIYAILHVDLIASSLAIGANIFSDTQGTASILIPIPNDPTLSGLTFFNQSVWAELRTCIPQPTFGLVTSRGFSIQF